MDFDFSRIKEEAGLFFNRFSVKTWLLAVLFIICFFSIVFFQVLGLFFGLALIFAVVFLLIFKKSRVSLQESKALLLLENKEAEKRFLKHLIDEKTFKKILSSNEKKIIEIEAALKAKDFVSEPSTFETSALSIRKRHKLKELLEEKQLLVSEFEIAKVKFFKHRLGEKEFQELSMEKQSGLVKLDTLISELYKEEAQEIMQDTARKLKSVRNDSSVSQPRRKQRQ